MIAKRANIMCMYIQLMINFFLLLFASSWIFCCLHLSFNIFFHFIWKPFLKADNFRDHLIKYFFSTDLILKFLKLLYFVCPVSTFFIAPKGLNASSDALPSITDEDSRSDIQMFADARRDF